MSTPPNTLLPLGSRVTLHIASLAAGGDGVARVDGCVVFVAGSVPGDRALVEIVNVSSNHVRARVVELLEPSPDRRAPHCAHFGRCGGCAWQHVKIEAQRSAKVDIVRNALARIGGVEAMPQIALIAAEEYGWRSRAVMRVVSSQGARRAGFQRAGSHEVEVVDDCPVLVDALRDELRALRESPESVPKAARRLYLAAGDGRARAVFADEDGRPLDPRAEPALVEQEVRGLRYAFDTDAFFQGHRELVAPLVAAAVEGVSGTTALDLYCGAGLFTLPLARAFERVIGVEGQPRAVELARANARRNGIVNATFECRPVEQAFELPALPHSVDCVLLDPPRTGAGARVVERIAELAPRAVHYVSCDPATLARDVRTFRAHGFELASVVALDLFPQTPHVECVVRLHPASTGPTRSTARSSD
jgi:23S rRNA (uracil1939-C5)-methyltransferase